MLKTVFVISSIGCVLLLIFVRLSWGKWVFLINSIVCLYSLVILNLNNFGYALDPEKMAPIKKADTERGDSSMDEKNKNNDTQTGQTIIGKRVRVTIGDQAPKEDDANTIVGEDTNLVVSPEEAQGKTIIGEKIELNIGNRKNGEIGK